MNIKHLVFLKIIKKVWPYIASGNVGALKKHVIYGAIALGTFLILLFVLFVWLVIAVLSFLVTVLLPLLTSVVATLSAQLSAAL